MPKSKIDSGNLDKLKKKRFCEQFRFISGDFLNLTIFLWVGKCNQIKARLIHRDCTWFFHA